VDQFVLNDDRSNETNTRSDRLDLIEDGLASGSLTKAELAEMLFDSLGLNKREAIFTKLFKYKPITQCKKP